MLVFYRSQSEEQLSSSLCCWCCPGSFKSLGNEIVLYPMAFRFCLRKSDLCRFHGLSQFLFPFVKSRAILNSRSLATELIGALRNFKASLAISGNMLLLVLQNWWVINFAPRFTEIYRHQGFGRIVPRRLLQPRPIIFRATAWFFKACEVRCSKTWCWIYFSLLEC